MMRGAGNEVTPQPEAAIIPPYDGMLADVEASFAVTRDVREIAETYGPWILPLIDLNPKVHRIGVR